MVPLLALLALLQTPDTVVVSAAEALRRSLEASPVTAAAHQRTLAADSRVSQARTFGNPTLSVTAENLGAAVETTGQPAWEGTEGQLLLGFRIPLGGDRGAAIRTAEAEAAEQEAREAVVSADVQVEAVDAIARLLRDRALLEHAVTDAEGMQALADAVGQQAERGRAPDGDAARLRLASTSAWARVASARTAEARSSADLARLIGLDPGTGIVVTLPGCDLPGPGGPPAPVEDTGPMAGGAGDAMRADAAPDLAMVDARIRTWEETEARLLAGAVPDLVPQVGWRRSGGFDALYVGLQLELPFFDRAQGARGAARLEASAAEADRAALSAWLEAQRAAAIQAVEALDRAGERFDDAWRAALARTVEAAEARYAMGEGTLTELLDSRRGRLDALAAFEGWRMELMGWRARAARYSGTPIHEGVFCDLAPNLETTR